jgi:hypothetical protein
MKKDGWADYPFSFHDSEELGPAILAKVSKKTPATARSLTNVFVRFSQDAFTVTSSRSSNKNLSPSRS